MRDFDARFTAYWSDRDMVDLLDVDTDLIPEDGGVYVLGTTSTPLIYPWCTSPVYYIGQSASLRRRLTEHRGYILEGREFGKYWMDTRWPRYQYAVAFGADCCWYTASRHDTTPEALEAELINEFYWVTGSIPIANGTWPAIKDLKSPRKSGRNPNTQ